MPGVLWKKFESDEVAANLAFIGAIRDEILDIETLAMNLLAQLQRMYPQRLAQRYRLEESDLALDAYDLLCDSGQKARHADERRRGEHRARGHYAGG